MSNREPSQNLESIRKTVKVLEALKDLESAGVTELASHLDMPKTTVHAHLSTLCECEIVTKVNGKYRTGLRLVQFGELAKNQFELYHLAKDEVDILSEESGDLTQFMVEDHGLGVYLYKAEPPRAVQVSAQIGDRRPLHCTALGKAILSRLPEERVEQVINRRGLEPQTENTITDRGELFDEIEMVRERGYAIDNEEIQKGLCCVAVPIDPIDRPDLGAISISGPISRMDDERLEGELLELLQKAANVIEINVQNI